MEIESNANVHRPKSPKGNEDGTISVSFLEISKKSINKKSKIIITINCRRIN